IGARMLASSLTSWTATTGWTGDVVTATRGIGFVAILDWLFRKAGNKFQLRILFGLAQRRGFQRGLAGLLTGTADGNTSSFCIGRKSAAVFCSVKSGGIRLSSTR